MPTQPPREALVLDTPDQIQAYRYIATVHGLRMEIAMQTEHGFPPTACPTRGRALRSAQYILRDHGRRVPRQRKGALRAMEALCDELGLPHSTGRTK